MTTDTAALAAPAGLGLGIGPGIIDCDVHPTFKNGLHDLAPYMSASWQQRLGVGIGARASNGFGASQYTVPLNTLHVNSAGPTRGDSSPNGGVPGSDPGFMAEQLLDGYGIARAILVSGHLLGIGAFPDPYVAATVASAYNDWMQELWLERDPRYRGALVVPPQAPDLAAAEIDRVADRPGIVAIFMPLHDIAMGERFYHPIYEAAERHGLPIIVHPSGTENVFFRAPRMAATATYYIEWHAALGQIHQSNTLSLLCHGVFEQFPELKVVVSEGGFIWAIETMLKLDRDWQGLRDEVPWLKRPPSEYLRKNMWFTTQPFPEVHKKEHLAPLMDMIYAEETMLFSTDYPHWDFDDPSRALAGLPEALRQRLFVDNAIAVFGERLR